jgi:hypothetical protein
MVRHLGACEIEDRLEAVGCNLESPLGQRKVYIRPLRPRQTPVPLYKRTRIVRVL